MADDPTLSTYGEMINTEFDLSDQDISREAINEEIADLFTDSTE
ncbi:hypothetical protein [Halobacterium jilantaiense]|uniref:Uncharacterized protein n=1 Tax=Halobacterium jilantaiense TaxID=355548 RepID=A0A1I0PUK4_9EURY|nr:hypothetical protein [Halobacterium jilantaiense]SEW18149.1 hypothetical protein SAMN04487945_1976 [Halobacterium jilantaiense]